MKRHTLAFLPTLLLLVAGCTTSPQPTASSKLPPPPPAATPSPAAPVNPAPAPAPAKPEPATPPDEGPTPDTYSLHHRVFPNLLFKTDGRFFTSLHGGDFNRLREIIAESYGHRYSNALRMKSVSMPDIVFITFEEPSRSPLCHHVALVKKGDTLLFLTLEKSEDILSTGVKTAFCGWTPEGNHLNYGPRKYTSLDEFEEEVRAFIAKQEKTKPAAITTPH